MTKVTPTYTISLGEPVLDTEPPPGELLGARYVYDGNGRGFCTPEPRSGERGTLVKSEVNGVVTFYPSTSYQEEGSRVTKYYSLGGQRVAMREDGVLSWLILDHLGSTNVTANEDGTLQSEIRYAPFGETRHTNGVTPSDYRYTGQLSQAELGLYYYVARWYDPQLGRFVQADTIVPNAGNSAAYDRYAYVLNNPIRMNDPNGHCVFDSNVSDMFSSIVNCSEDIKLSINAYRSGEGRVGALLSHGTGLTKTIIGLGALTSRWNQDIGVITSDRPLKERIILLIEVGVAGTLIAASLVGPPKGIFPNLSGNSITYSDDILDEAFVRFDPSKYDSVIDEIGYNINIPSDKRIWLTKFKYIKNVDDPNLLETMLYRKDLWSIKAGSFSEGATLRSVAVDDAIPAGMTNLTNGVPQWYVTKNIPVNLIRIIRRIAN